MSGSRILFALCGLLRSTNARAAPEHPPDPFAAEYVVPEDRDVGTTAGQIQLMANPMFGVARQGTSVGGQLTIELMARAAIGIRAALQADLLHSASDPGLFAARIGPSLHLFPYHRFDLSLFVESGVALIDPPTGHDYLVPTLSPGFDVELWLSSSWFVCAEGHLDWLSLETPGAPQKYLRASGTAGLGLGF